MYTLKYTTRKYTNMENDMYGREKELKRLKELYDSKRFEFLIMYGRRRVGKTTLLEEFSRNTNSIFFPAREKNDALNLQDFSKTIQLHFNHSFIAPFPSWESAFEYIGEHVKKRMTIIIDEFPYIISENPTVKSLLQHAIDHSWKNKNIFLIVCGSSISIMENDILGNKSPLHDRQTATMEVIPFNYVESCAFLSTYSNLDKIQAYGILGGIPRYLEAFDPFASIEKNIADKILRNGSYLYEEPNNLLKAELRETNIYNSILMAIASGKNRIAEIANYIHEDRTKVAKYLITLQMLRLVEKRVPCGEDEKSKKSIYVLKDYFFQFWFRYVFNNDSYYAILGYDEAAKEIMTDLSNYMGNVFEEICKEYLVDQAKRRKLPFVPYSIGKWWGNNPFLKEQDDVDVLAIDKTQTKAIFMECKFTTKPMPYREYEDLLNATKAFPNIKEKYLYFVSKSGFTEPVKRQAKIDDAVLLSIDDLFD